MKRMMIAASAAVLLASAAFAGDGGNLAGSTVRVTGSDGSVFEITFHAGGAYADHRGPTGVWELNGEELCLTNDPVTLEDGGEFPSQTQCGPWNPALAPGEVWETEGWAPEGRLITIEMLG
ncbi:MAG: hypothetical protein KIS81_00905 [Maricaulaceae bacterium]|nr:hypothetical protein [Maricaulaceae bacterium]